MKAPKAWFKILPFTNPRTGTASWRVTGTRRNGERIRENFVAADEAQYRHTELEAEFHAANGVAALRATRLTDVIEDFDDTRAVEWFAALDYGFAHYTVVLLGCRDGDGNTFIVDEHAERLWLPQRHAAGIKAMLARHVVPVDGGLMRVESRKTRPLELADLKRFVAGADVF